MADEIKPSKSNPVAMMRFDKIPIDVDGKTELFSFRRVDEDAGGIWIAHWGTKRLYIDDDLNFENLNMPPHWIVPVVETLRTILIENYPEKVLDNFAAL